MSFVDISDNSFVLGESMIIGNINLYLSSIALMYESLNINDICANILPLNPFNLFVNTNFTVLSEI